MLLAISCTESPASVNTQSTPRLKLHLKKFTLINTMKNRSQILDTIIVLNSNKSQFIL